MNYRLVLTNKRGYIMRDLDGLGMISALKLRTLYQDDRGSSTITRDDKTPIEERKVKGICKGRTIRLNQAPRSRLTDKQIVAAADRFTVDGEYGNAAAMLELMA